MRDIRHPKIKYIKFITENGGLNTLNCQNTSSISPDLPKNINYHHLEKNKLSKRILSNITFLRWHLQKTLIFFALLPPSWNNVIQQCEVSVNTIIVVIKDNSKTEMNKNHTYTNTHTHTYTTIAPTHIRTS